MSTKKSRFQGLFEPQGNQTEQAVREQAEDVPPPTSGTRGESKKPRKQETKKARNQEGVTRAVPRVKTNYEIRQDYVRTLKRIAVDEGRKIYEVMEEAIGQYIERHSTKNG